ncbi:MAG: conserved rane protein of unknown function [Blastococcus sp.]|jgi:hypothetical protein|nr:conserved rane protein of unknown function [Blastococcus sp.]
MAATAGNNSGAGRRTLPQTLSLVFGVVYLLVGIVGFFVTGFDDFASPSDKTLLIFDINPLHNIAHILVGIAGIALARTLASARTYGWLLAVLYGALFIYGLIAAGESWDFLNINGADNGLHIVTALVGLVIALMPVRDAVSHRAART